jgi:hypothetical protein
MFELGTEMMRQKLRREHPDADEEEIRSRYLAWLHDRPGAEHGDGVGRPDLAASYSTRPLGRMTLSRCGS